MVTDMNHSRFLPLVCASLLSLLHPPLAAQDVEDVDALEKTIAAHVEKMQDRDPSTAGMLAAIDWEEQQWDTLLNTAYRALLAKLPEKGRESLRASQRAWLTFRDAEYKTLDGVFSTREGTMYLPIAADARMRITKHRASELASLVRVFRIDGN